MCDSRAGHFCVSAAPACFRAQLLITPSGLGGHISTSPHPDPRPIIFCQAGMSLASRPLASPPACSCQLQASSMRAAQPAQPTSDRHSFLTAAFVDTDGRHRAHGHTSCLCSSPCGSLVCAEYAVPPLLLSVKEGLPRGGKVVLTEPAKVSESRWRFSRKGDWILPKVASDIDGHHRCKASIRLFKRREQYYYHISIAR
jgi:hypothetical protein